MNTLRKLIVPLATTALLAACSVDTSVFGTPSVDVYGDGSSGTTASAGSASGGVGGAASTNASSGSGSTTNGTATGSTGSSASSATAGVTGSGTSASVSASAGSASSGGTSSSSSGAATSTASASVSSSSTSAASSSSTGGGVDHAIPCGGNQTCANVCCLGLLQQTCADTAASCSQFQSAFACNDGADCGGGVCCLKSLGFGKVDVQCAAACQGKGTRILCASLMDCPMGAKSCNDATNIGLPGFSYCKF